MKKDIRRFMLFSVLTLVLGLALATTSSARGGHDGYDGHGKGKYGGDHQQTMQRVFDELDLSEVQQKAITEFQEEHRKSAKGNYKEMKEIRKALKEEITKKDTDMGKVTEMTDKLKKHQADMIDHRIEGMLAIKKILTPDQYEKFGEKIGDMRKGCKGKKGHKGWKKDRKDDDNGDD